jgi:DNA mismatch repair ATPase MutL
VQEETEIVIHGFVSKPEFAKKKGKQFFFVNDRFIKWLFASCDNGCL